MQPNARGEPCPRAGVRHERRLLGVGSSAMLGQDFILEMCKGREYESDPIFRSSVLQDRLKYKLGYYPLTVKTLILLCQCDW
jgi:hypothetical protein